MVLVLVGGLMAAPAQAALSWCDGGCRCRASGGSALGLEGRCHCCPERPSPGALQPWSGTGLGKAVRPVATRLLAPVSTSLGPVGAGLAGPLVRPNSTARARPGPAMSRWGPRHAALQSWRC